MTVIAPRSGGHDASDDGGLGPMPPNDIEAEQSVLGSMMLSKAAIEEVVEVLGRRGGQQFHRPAHVLVYAAIVDLYARGNPVDAILLRDELTKRGEIDRVGGAPYLHTLISSVPTTGSAGYYARIVVEQATLKRLAEVGTRIVQMAHSAPDDVDQVLDRAADDLARVGQGGEQRDVTNTLGALLPGVLADIERNQTEGGTKGVMTGFADVDGLTNGLQAGQMIIIAGRPGMGKTTFAIDIARHAALACGRKVAFFSLEMHRDELVQRIISAEARVALHHLRGTEMTPHDWDRVTAAMNKLSSDNLFITDGANTTLTQIKAECRRIKQRHGGLDLIVIDYLQLLGGSGGRAENRQAEVSEISRNTKLLAKELEIPVLALSQLNRGAENREDKTPRLAELRESGSLEQDSDVVFLLHRDDAYTKESPRAGEADVIVAKHRNGATPTITLAFQGHYSRFRDMPRA
ncbi:replicative DNA helicase [Embleya hyalina]|uniref:Replicative DNA helicase n=2 Tax=Embleya hyalina TaxID=516124 RepID=A0A401Z3X1_9ACTN|nr:replicative DNA helicase [Embleya hyalina]